MPDETKDWSGFAMQIAVHPESGFGPKGEPLGWRVIAPGSGGTPEEAANYAAWERWKAESLPKYAAPWHGNAWAAYNGWPLPEPHTGTDGLDIRKYDRARFPAGRIITDRREAAIFTPGEPWAQDVDTTVDPPVFKDAPPTVEPSPDTSPVPEPTGSQAVTPAGGPPSPARRVPKVGDRVVIELPCAAPDECVLEEGVIEATLTTADGDTSRAVRIAAGWGYVVGWLA